MKTNTSKPARILLSLLIVTGCTPHRQVKESTSEPGYTHEYDYAAADEEMDAADMAEGGFAMPEPVMPPQDQPAFNTERYSHIEEQNFMNARATPLSTFSIDVDTAGYSLVRRHLTNGSMPPAGAVRIEEMLNYFDYTYEGPKDGTPFAIHTAVAVSPWNSDSRLVRIGIKGREMPVSDRPDATLIFLIDVSGSMEDPNKLPLLRQSLSMLTKQLGENDDVGIVVYAGASGVVLEPTSDRSRILAALERLQAGGSTNGGAGIELAYKLAKQHFKKSGINRVILATDGDFNVGQTSESDLVTLIEEKAASGIFLSVLGFGDGNYNDATMEKIADKGNGNYAYIDTIDEAQKVLVKQMSGTLVTIASDVKIQVEFNPELVSSYRLIGYENRALAAEDFNDDKKDAGEIGAGHTVTALYEVIPAGRQGGRSVDPLRYQKKSSSKKSSTKDELLTVKVRYKQPGAAKSELLTRHVANQVSSVAETDADFRFAAAVAGFGMKLRGSKHAGRLGYTDLIKLAKSGLGSDDDGFRAEFLGLVRKAERLSINH
jgi:Ca-activated chloride channel family protein